MKKDYIPAKDNEFDSFQSNLMSQVTTNSVLWNIIVAALTALNPLQMAWAAAWLVAKVKVNRSPAVIAAKKQSRKAYEAALRTFIQTNIYRNPSMTDGDIEVCGLRPHDHTRTPVPVPTDQPIVVLKHAPGNYFVVRFFRLRDEQGALHRGKPDKVAKIEFAYSLNNQPGSPDNCPEKRVATRGPIRVELPLNYNGQTVWFYARWKNVYDAAGPWTELDSFVL